jgi:wyosine [tRNA(Phe)-imidazoG37] synthetase (radical SAM superfamily)
MRFSSELYSSPIEDATVPGIDVLSTKMINAANHNYRLGDRLSKFTFGPVRSRRLGMSLGVNNVPYKTCSYSCIYCQLGRTGNFSIERREFYRWEDIVEDVLKSVEELEGKLDYVTFVPDGEPLLDKSIGKEIEEIKKGISVPIAVITNSSLLFLEECRRDLSEADLVSLKVDAFNERVWRTVNRPHPRLKLNEILYGIEEFSKDYRGKIITETMLVKGFNEERVELEKIASFLQRLNPHRAYISIPVRPPAESYATPPEPEKLVEAYEVFREKLGEGKVELLNLPEPPPPSAHGDPKSWLLSVTSVHPLRLKYALSSLRTISEDPEKVISELEDGQWIRIVEYMGEKFVVRWFKDIRKLE